jgi:predicted SprT family Zn-dependent metalloprotease
MAKAKGKPEEVVKVKSTTKIMHCKCNNEYQDARYGNKNRVFNARQAEKKTGEYRCTVCGTTVKA